jgi:ATP-dependent DNA helicase DinG
MIALRDSIGSDLVERTESVFAPGGLLAKAKNFERRPQQQQMAVAVARALEEERHLVVEAGTGIGKSLAYLVPAVLFALGQKKKGHHLDAHHQSAGATSLQRHSDSAKSSPRDVRGNVD